MIIMSPSKPQSSIEEFAKDYAEYGAVDITNQMSTVHDTIEDMMMRLEEFESIVGMVRTEGARCTNGYVPTLQAAKPELINLCKRVDALENVVATANANLCALETAVDTAEVESWVSNTKFIGLSFFKKNQEPVRTAGRKKFQPTTIYNSADYFKKG